MSLVFVETHMFYHRSTGFEDSLNVDSRMRLAPNNSSVFPWIKGSERKYSLYTELTPITRREIEVFW